MAVGNTDGLNIREGGVAWYTEAEDAELAFVETVDRDERGTLTGVTLRLFDEPEGMIWVSASEVEDGVVVGIEDSPLSTTVYAAAFKAIRFAPVKFTERVTLGPVLLNEGSEENVISRSEAASTYRVNRITS